MASYDFCIKEKPSYFMQWQKAFNEVQHPRDDRGRFIDKGDVDNDSTSSLVYKLRTKLKKVLKKYIGYYKNNETGNIAKLSNKSISKIASDKAIEKSKNNGFSLQEHFEVAERIVDLYRKSKLIKIHNDIKHNDNNMSIERYSKNVILQSGKKAVAYITVKHTLSTDGRRIYSIETMNIKKTPDKTGAMERTAVTKSTSLYDLLAKTQIVELSSKATQYNSIIDKKGKKSSDISKSFNIPYENIRTYYYL